VGLNTIMIMWHVTLCLMLRLHHKASHPIRQLTYEGWKFNSGNYLFTTDTK